MITITSFYFILKLINLLMSWVALQISTNYISQIYLDKRIINESAPPSLTYIFIVYGIITIAIQLMILLFLFTIVNVFKSEYSTVMTYYLNDMIINTLVTGFISMGILKIITNKKAFLYADQGLMTIRATREIMWKIILVQGFIPYGLFLSGSAAELVDILQTVAKSATKNS